MKACNFFVISLLTTAHLIHYQLQILKLGIDGHMEILKADHPYNEHVREAGTIQSYKCM